MSIAAPQDRESPRWHRMADAALAIAVVVFWRFRYGALGPDFNADGAVMGAMALRPLSRESFYFWGQDRLGALIPLLARGPVHLLGTEAGATAQAIAYVAAGVMVFAFLRLFRSLPWKLAVAALLAFPALELARWMLDPSQPGPVAGTSAALQLLAFLAALRRPSRANIALASFLAGFTVWAGENCTLFLPAELAVLVILGRRALAGGRREELLRSAGSALAGLAPPVLLVGVGKLFSFRVPAYYRLRHFEDGLSVFAHLQPQFRELAPIGGWVYAVAGVLALFAGIELWRWARSGEREPEAWALLGTGPLLAFWFTSFTDWFRANYYSSRYLAFGVIVGAVASGLLLEAWAIRLRPGLRRVATPAAALGFALLWLGSPLPLRSERSRVAATQWRAKTAVALEAGCQGLIGDYWQSYPYLTLSQGTILATPQQKARVRSKPLAADAVRQAMVCVVPWEAPLDSCPPELTQFEARLTLRDRYEGKAGEESIVLCRYRSSLAAN